VKRAFDVLVAGIGLVVLAPLLAMVAALVALTSRGPVLFRQQRVGRHGKPFEMLKFRSMVVAPAGSGPLVTIAGDRRITPVGRLLRATKLDELPQLWNVVRGDMSLVGPRPEVSKYVALYPPDVAIKVLSVRPGITDEASIVFRNESEILGRAADPERAYVEEILPRKLALYERYAERHSVRGDLGIIARTLWCIVAGRGSDASSHQSAGRGRAPASEE
jgi:lipopolysaccharide/colanic/teichoic acid biosynthesis glycosyltransferase